MRKILFFTLFLVSALFSRSVVVPVINSDSGISSLYMDINGKNINFQNFPGKYVLLEYFGAHCPVCKSEVKHMKMINQQNPLVKVVAVEVQDTKEDALKDFISKNGIKYPIVSFKNSLEFYNYVPEWKGRIPMMILFAPNGEPIKRFKGFKKAEDIMNTINEYKNR